MYLKVVSIFWEKAKSFWLRSPLYSRDDRAIACLRASALFFKASSIRAVAFLGNEME